MIAMRSTAIPIMAGRPISSAKPVLGIEVACPPGRAVKVLARLVAFASNVANSAIAVAVCALGVSVAGGATAVVGTATTGVGLEVAVAVNVGTRSVFVGVCV